MIEVTCEQGSEAWWEARAGIPTASCFSKILTPKTLRPSAQRHAYAAKLAAEWVLGGPADEFMGDYWVERGKALEPRALTRYAATRGVRVRKTGFCYLDEHRHVGCSPDALVDPDRGLELKCPQAGTHLAWIAGQVVPPAHVMQVQGSLWVTKRDYWDFASFHPDIEGMSLFVVASTPEPAYQDAFDAHVPAFVAEVMEMRASLLEQGVRPLAEVLAEQLAGHEDDGPWGDIPW